MGNKPKEQGLKDVSNPAKYRIANDVGVVDDKSDSDARDDAVDCALYIISSIESDNLVVDDDLVVVVVVGCLVDNDDNDNDGNILYCGLLFLRITCKGVKERLLVNDKEKEKIIMIIIIIILILVLIITIRLPPPSYFQFMLLLIIVMCG